MMQPPRKRLGRKIGDFVQDVKQDIRASKGSRAIKRSMKDTAQKSSKEKSNRREEIMSNLETASKEKKSVFKRVPRETRRTLAESGVGIKRTQAVKPTLKARAAKRTLGMMESQDKRRLKRKIR